MKIRSIKTKLEHTVTAQEWEQMQARGDAKKYTIVSSSPEEKPQPPAGADDADYNGILKRARNAFKNKKYATAKQLFEQAAAIKETAFIKSKLAELESLLSIEE